MGLLRVSSRKIVFLLATAALLLVALVAAASRSTPKGPAPGPSVPMFAGNAQHTAIYEPAAQDLNRIHWSTSVDENNTGALAHYGAPLVTAANTVIVPVKIAGNGFRVDAFDAANGSLKYSLATDYVLPTHGWIPVYNPCLTTGVFGTRLYYAGRGGTIYYVDNPDSAAHGPPVQQAFYGTLADYLANSAAYNSTIFINTPLTADSNGNVFFGFRVQGTAPDPLNSAESGFARIDPNGNGTYILTRAASGDNSINWDSHNSAPALSNDESTLYVLAKASSTESGYLLGLDSTTLAPKYRVFLNDPRNGNPARIRDDGTASPTVAPDNDVYIGILGNPNNGFRGFLLRFNSDLTVEKTPGGFGWDYTPALVPATMVPSYQGPSSYLIFAKYNNYAFGDGNGVNRIAVLDPNTTQLDPHTSAVGLVEMREVLTMIGPTPDNQPATFPYAVREWCINTAAVDPATNSIFVPNENGFIHRWNLATNSLSQAASIGPGIGQPYVPTIIGPDGKIYSMNGGTLFALGGLSGVSVTLASSIPDTRTVVVGESLTFTATVTNTGAGAPGTIPAGTVTFQDFTYQNLTPVTTTLASNVPLDANGQASITTSGLMAGNGFRGNHFITATYSGDGNFPGGSTTLVQKVHAKASTTTLSSSPNPSDPGQAITFTATVASASDSTTPTGMVTFQEGSTVLAQVPLNAGGTASFQADLNSGSHTITAIYASDTVFAASSGDTVHTVTGTPTPTPTPTPGNTPTPTPTATATPSSSPSATPTATAAQPLNLSTRMRVRSGDNVGIGGFIITGNDPKQVLLRAIGPSLTSSGVVDPLPDPVLELHGPGGFVTVTNDNWRDDPVQEALIKSTGIPPTSDLESAIHVTLVPGAYTAVMRGKGEAEGVGLVEIYDLNPGASSRLANLSTRALVGISDDIVIAGFILGQQNGAPRIAVRGLGPSLASAGIANPLANPVLELRDGNGALVLTNNDWQDNSAQAAALSAAGLAPTNQLEAGLVATLPPGLYTALLAGLNSGTGIALVEVYDLGP